MLERLPTPWGLVRLGVAPDHPKLKEVSRAFERTRASPASASSATSSRARRHARGAARALRRGRLRGRRADRPPARDPRRGPARSWAATEFVAWYNGHPDYQDLEFDLSRRACGRDRQRQRRARRRPDARADARGARPTDTTDAAIEAIADRGIREIVVVGRRGPVQAAWTPVEVGELGDLAGADILLDPAELELDEQSDAELEAAPGTVKRNVEHLRGYAARGPKGSRGRSGCVSSPRPSRSSARARRGRSSSSATSSSTDGLAPSRPTTTRRSSAESSSAASATTASRSRASRSTSGAGRSRTTAAGRPVGYWEYVAGWIKRGPSGIIGTNKKDANETVELLLEDAAAGSSRTPTTATSPTCSPSAAPARRLRGLGGDRPRREPPASRTAARGSSSRRWDELLAASGAVPRSRDAA